MIFNSLDIMKPEQFFEEVDSVDRLGKQRKADRKEKKAAAAAEAATTLSSPLMGGDGASIEVAKRPRGRPPGSRNKPKPPEVITKEADPSASMRSHVLEIAGGNDVIDCLARFSRRRKLGICVLAGTGSVSNVTLRQPGPDAEAAIVFHGRCEILSISATFMPPAMAALSPSAAASGGMSISLAGPQGQIIGGVVVGPLVAAGVVMVVAAAFVNPTFHRLPLEDDVSVSVSVSVSGGDPAPEAAPQPQKKQQIREEEQRYYHHFHLQQPHSSVPPLPPPASAAAEPGGIGMYGTHFSSEIMWPPSSRQSHPPNY
ncbi:putative DNA-binding protein ESCAROLA [Platanthera zijinensis]|uniref:DNA-binding protein ESCAROLA n=1 Tax=Platanthera zijinensis TaxID=2320716 RepID=A0AAP0B727_9ASPA